MTVLHLDAAPRRPLLLASLRDWLARRREARDLRIGIERLAALSPHLLADIGISDTEVPPPDPEPLIFGRA